MIGKLNLYLLFNVYTLAQDDAGGTGKTLDSTYYDWCSVEQVNGSRRLEQSQIAFSKAYRITKRHYAALPIAPDVNEIVYGSDTLSIADVKLITEGRTTYEEILCYTNA